MFGGLVSAILAAIVFVYVYNLEQDEKCGCSKDWRRDFIKAYSGVLIVLTSIGFLIQVSGVNINGTLRGVVKSIGGIMGLVAFVYIYALFTYSQKLIIEKCECSDNWQRTFIYYYSMVLAVIMLFVVIGLVSLLISKKKGSNITQVRNSLKKLGSVVGAKN